MTDKELYHKLSIQRRMNERSEKKAKWRKEHPGYISFDDRTPFCISDPELRDEVSIDQTGVTFDEYLEYLKDTKEIGDLITWLRVNYRDEKERDKVSLEKYGVTYHELVIISVRDFYCYERDPVTGHFKKVIEEYRLL